MWSVETLLSNKLCIKDKTEIIRDQSEKTGQNPFRIKFRRDNRVDVRST